MKSPKNRRGDPYQYDYPYPTKVRNTRRKKMLVSALLGLAGLTLVTNLAIKAVKSDNPQMTSMPQNVTITPYPIIFETSTPQVKGGGFIPIESTPTVRRQPTPTSSFTQVDHLSWAYSCFYDGTCYAGTFFGGKSVEARSSYDYFKYFGIYSERDMFDIDMVDAEYKQMVDAWIEISKRYNEDSDNKAGYLTSLAQAIAPRMSPPLTDSKVKTFVTLIYSKNKMNPFLTQEEIASMEKTNIYSWPRSSTQNKLFAALVLARELEVVDYFNPTEIGFMTSLANNYGINFGGVFSLNGKFLESLDDPIEGSCPISQKFGRRDDDSFHAGLDIADKSFVEGKTEIHAVSDGRIVHVGDIYGANEEGKAGGGSYSIIIDHGNGYFSTYLHNDGVAPGIQVGSYVLRGDTLAYLGNRGKSTAPHLHIEIIRNAEFRGSEKWWAPWRGLNGLSYERLDPALYLPACKE